METREIRGRRRENGTRCDLLEEMRVDGWGDSPGWAADGERNKKYRRRVAAEAMGPDALPSSREQE
jgi:hypothetical protein